MRIVMICRLCRPLSPILVGLLLLMACGPGAAFAEGSPTTESPDAAIQIPTTTPIKHLVSIMQSNHSFDSLFGTYPGVDGIPANACMPLDPNMRGGDCVPPFAMTNNGADFDHTHNTFKNQYRDGENNGFISSFRQ